jgi:hypothetical protein
MNSGNKLNSYLPSIIIDVGSDNVKFTQPILNTYSISQLLREEDDFIGEESKKIEGIVKFYLIRIKSERTKRFYKP